MPAFAFAVITDFLSALLQPARLPPIERLPPFRSAPTNTEFPRTAPLRPSIAFGPENRYKLSVLEKSPQDIIIDKMVQRIVDYSHPLKIILFGSRARGTARPDSDVDLLIVLPSVGSKTRAAAELYGHLGAVGLSKDIVIITSKELDDYKNVEGTVIKPALEEGKVLYERVA